MRYKAIAGWILLLCLFITACGHTQPDPSGVRFYYNQADVAYDSNDGLIGYQPIANTAPASDWVQLLEDYLRGPTDSQFVSPFPAGTHLVYFTVSQDTAQAVLSHDFADIAGADLTIACACFALTVQSITHCSVVEISAVDALLDGQSSITIDPCALSLYDSTQ
jgi:hypothetical protein